MLIHFSTKLFPNQSQTLIQVKGRFRVSSENLNIDKFQMAIIRLTESLKLIQELIFRFIFGLF